MAVLVEPLMPVIGPRMSATAFPLSDAVAVSSTSLGAELANIYLHARYYDPALGMFLSPDPAWADLNTYRYAFGDSVNFSDPSGLDPDDCGSWTNTSATVCSGGGGNSRPRSPGSMSAGWMSNRWQPEGYEDTFIGRVVEKIDRLVERVTSRIRDSGQVEKPGGPQGPEGPAGPGTGTGNGTGSGNTPGTPAGTPPGAPGSGQEACRETGTCTCQDLGICVPPPPTSTGCTFGSQFSANMSLIHESAAEKLIGAYHGLEGAAIGAGLGAGVALVDAGMRSPVARTFAFGLAAEAFAFSAEKSVHLVEGAIKIELLVAGGSAVNAGYSVLSGSCH